MAERDRLGNIIQQLSCVTTCFPSTVALLKELLDDRIDTKVAGSVPKPNRNATKAPRSITAPRKIAPGARTRTNTTVPLKVHCEEPSTLSTEQKLALATQVCNHALKALSQASKSTNTQQDCNSQTRPPTKRANGCVEGDTALTKPLQPRSPNKGRGTSRRDSVGSSVGKGQHVGASSVAECARIAISCMRRLGSKQKTLDIQLETAALSLIGRCVSLGVHSTAIRELCVMYKSIQRHLFDTESEGSKKGNEILSLEKDGIVGVLDNHGHIPTDLTVLSLITSMQCFAVRIITARKRQAEMHGLCTQLDMNKLDSLSNLLLLQASQDAASLDI
jgi:hypothetical protein